MSISSRKITTYEDSISALPDRPCEGGYTAAQLKEKFDGRTDNEIKDSINGLIDDLLSTLGAQNIGNAALYMDGGETVAEQLEELKEDKVSRDPDDLPSGIDAQKIGSGSVTNAQFNNLSGTSGPLQQQIDGCVKKEGNEQIGGTKTFLLSPSVPYPEQESHAATKKYVDDTLIATGSGDMTKAMYDTNSDGKVDAADVADALSGTLEISGGGTGAATAQGALENLGAAAAQHTHSISDISGMYVISAAAVTLVAAGWMENTQIQAVTGVTATNNVIVSPDPASQEDYSAAGIYCSSQGSGVLTFTCGTAPANDIDVNVLIIG